MIYALVYSRPDGWWEAGRGWTTLEGAKEDGLKHDWGRTEWGVIEVDPTSNSVEKLLEPTFAVRFKLSNVQPICLNCYNAMYPDMRKIRDAPDFKDPEKCVNCGVEQTKGVWFKIGLEESHYPTNMEEVPS